MMQLIQTILKPLSVSGREEAAARVVTEEILPLVDECRTDALGNVIAVKYGRGKEKRKLMYAAHLDEVGFITTYIEENGLLRFQTLGRVNLASAAYTTVVFENGVQGVLVPETGGNVGDFQQNKFVVDIGATSKKEAERKVSLGITFAVESAVTRLMGNRIAGRPLDDRIGAAVLIEAARRNPSPYHDVTYVFSVQEEVGCRGSKPAAYAIAPDYGIALTVTEAGDSMGAKQPAVKLGGGAAIKLKDSGVLYDRYLVEKMKEAAQTEGIRYQYEIGESSCTDASSMQQTGAGARAGCLSVPARYLHSSVETVDLDDVEECVKLVVALNDMPLD